jgi:hypothetical protein
MSIDYRIGMCRIVCNPLGRAERNLVRPCAPCEKGDFEPTLIIEI